MKMKKLGLCILLLLACSLLLTSPVFAGDWIDHGGDWGGSDWGGDYGDDWGGSDYGDSYGGGIFIFDSDGGGDLGSFGLILAIAIILVVVFFVFSMRKSSGNRSAGRGGYTSSPMQMSDTSSVNPLSLSKLKEADPQFSEAAMLSKAENLFTTMQLAWCEQDYEPVRPFLSNALYEQQAKQLEAKKARDEKNISSEIAVLQSKLESYSSDGHTEYLNVWLRVKMKDYVVRISDPSVIISGTPDRMYYLDFRWTFTRSAGAVTDAATDAVKTGECPCCGANINMNQSGKCEYCGSVISTTEYDWVLSKIDGLQQRSR